MVKYFFFLFFSVLFTANAQTKSSYFAIGEKPYSLLKSKLINKNTSVKPVIVAVLDDAFSLSHQRLSPYYFTNTGEIKNNQKDDDLNGYVDDLRGWDMADGDGKVNPPQQKVNNDNFLHGSMIAGSIIHTAELTLGQELTKKYIKILPVKVISDEASIENYEKGYEGLKYAIEMGADIICLPWSGGAFDDKYLPLFETAHQKGILILASAGNFYSDLVQKPGGLPAVYTVAAVDTSFHKLPSSNYNMSISLSAVGQNVLAPFAYNDTLFTYLEKTSAAVGLITGCSAVIKALSPEMSPDEIIDLLQNTATSLDNHNRDYLGKLGGGVPNMGQATDYLLNGKVKLNAYFDPQRAKGSLLIGKKESVSDWEINLPSDGTEMVFSLVGDSRNMEKQLLHFSDADGRSLQQSSLKDFPEDLRFKNQRLKIHLDGKFPSKPLRLKYYTITKDSATMYCHDTVELTGNTGSFEDGSKEAVYSGNCSCKWLVTVEKGKNVRLDFPEFATEEVLDNVLIFKGNLPLQENMMARFSGQQAPPSVVIDGNQVLVWFMTNKNNPDKGFKITYEATSANPGVIE